MSLDEIAGVSLLERDDTKFTATLHELREFLKAVGPRYRVLEIDGRRLHAYRTLYFDSPTLDLYRSHHSGQFGRRKVRNREYRDTSEAFSEVKLKAKRGRTVKHRESITTIDTPPWDAPSLLEDLEPLRMDLEPALLNEFSRVTLVAHEPDERVTIDLDLCFWSATRSVALPGVVVIEAKQARVDRWSPAILQARRQRLHPGFSKYCVGVALLYEGVKHNNFKPTLLQLERTMRSAS